MKRRLRAVPRPIFIPELHFDTADELVDYCANALRVAVVNGATDESVQLAIALLDGTVKTDRDGNIAAALVWHSTDATACAKGVVHDAPCAARRATGGIGNGSAERASEQRSEMRADTEPIPHIFTST